MTDMTGRDSATASLLAVATGAPQPWQLGFQSSASPVMERLNSVHNLLLVITGAVLVLVLALLLYVIIRYNERVHPEPKTTTHHTVLEVIWTVVPVLLLVVIAVPSLGLLYYMDRPEKAELTVKVIGHQWYWQYQIPDHGGLDFTSVVVADDDIKQGQLRLLEVDTPLVLPVDTDILLVVSADDVIHSWSIPALGIKVDAIPGRRNMTWVRIEHEGAYYGQCSQLCGINHTMMPIKVEAIPRAQYFAALK
jgi:cytochrome c oxidase subunit 2